jgi:hypothetical protein
MDYAKYTIQPLAPDPAIEEYCRLDAELTRMLFERASGFCFWSSPAYIAQHPERVHVDADGFQTHYK